MIHAKLTPVAKPKKPSVSTTKVGLVKVQIETAVDRRTGKTRTRYRTYCTKAIVPKDQQRREWPSMDDAHAFAAKLNAAIQAGKIEEIDTKSILVLKRIAEDFKVRNVLDEVNPDTQIMGVCDYEAIFRIGSFMVQTINKNNTQREKNGLKKYTSRQAIGEFDRFLEQQSEKETAPDFKELIEKCVVFKTGKHGGAGNTELEQTSKREWRVDVGEYLAEWIGHFSTTESRKVLQAAVRNGINRGFDARKGENLGKPWGQMTKYKKAKKASEFGKWCVEHEEEYLSANPFKILPRQFKPTTQTRADILKVAQVEKLFEVLASNKRYHRMIPYYALLFFSGGRPASEVAHPSQSHRRLQWEIFDGWERDSVVSGGKRFEVLARDHLGRRRSKSNIDRTADLTPNGVEWIKWAFGELPNDGEVYYDRDLVKAIRTEADLWGKDSKGKAKWPPDVARHSMSTYVAENNDFNVKVVGYWHDCLGHSPAQYKRHYQGRVENQADRTAYFAIRPPKKTPAAA